MNRNVNIANRLKEVLLDGTWIANTNYKAQLEGVTWLQATVKVGGLNCIAALTFHINYYLQGLLNAFGTGRLEISDKYSFDMPEIKNEADWNRLIADFLSNAERFVAQVQIMDEALLDEIFIDERYGTYLRNIEGVIEHSYYHLGQISLIKKLIFTG